jgi:hypothetical protein
VAVRSSRPTSTIREAPSVTTGGGPPGPAFEVAQFDAYHHQGAGGRGVVSGGAGPAGHLHHGVGSQFGAEAGRDGVVLRGPEQVVHDLVQDLGDDGAALGVEVGVETPPAVVAGRRPGRLVGVVGCGAVGVGHVLPAAGEADGVVHREPLGFMQQCRLVVVEHLGGALGAHLGQHPGFPHAELARRQGGADQGGVAQGLGDRGQHPGFPGG